MCVIISYYIISYTIYLKYTIKIKTITSKNMLNLIKNYILSNNFNKLIK